MSISEVDPSATRLLRRVDRVIGDLRRGVIVFVDGGGQSLAVQAAELASTESLAQLGKVGGGTVSLALTRRRAAALGLTPMPSGPGGSSVLALPRDTEPGFVHMLADPGAAVAGLALAAPDGDRLVDGAIELVKLARLLPAAVIVPLAAAAAQRFAATEGLLAVAAADVFAYEASAANSLRIISEARVPLADAEHTRLVHFRPRDGGVGHIAIVIGEPDPAQPVLVRLHSECFTGDLLGSLRCDCGDQLRGAIVEIAKNGGGAVLYLSQEGRGIGLANKLRAYELQDGGFDTIDANELLGFDADERVYLPAAAMLRQLGFTKVRLLTNNPEKVAALARCGIEVVERVPHAFPANAHNERYLRTKAIRGGHLL
ncbi:MAG TPA: GTP cyclohydrolase II [Stellaceae bacterium]